RTIQALGSSISANLGGLVRLWVSTDLRNAAVSVGTLVIQALGFLIHAYLGDLVRFRELSDHAFGRWICAELQHGFNIQRLLLLGPWVSADLRNAAVSVRTLVIQGLGFPIHSNLAPLVRVREVADHAFRRRIRAEL